MRSEVDVAVLGAGPAGVAAAVRLRALGHSVLLLGSVGSGSVEGLSQRAHALLTALDLRHAVGSAQGPGTRSGVWAGAAVGMNGEYVVDRTEFNRALSLDSTSHDVQQRPEQVVAVRKDGAIWRVQTRAGEILCRSVVDARGRRLGRPLSKGPSLIALSQRLENVREKSARTLIVPVESGWCWFATAGQGRATLQWITSSGGLRAGRADLTRLVLAHLPRVAKYVRGCEYAAPVGSADARAATARMLSPAPHAGYVRAGDAAVACDPLSGQGLHEALRSASLVTAALHTYLTQNTCDAWDCISRFLEESSRELWITALTAATAFYQAQAAQTPTPFWVGAARTYEELRPPRLERDSCRIESRPVLNGSLIEMREVVVTAERPRGVWRVDSVELAGLIELFHNEPKAGIEHAARVLERRPAAVLNAVRWLTAHGLMKRL